jgi:hypothetical protein
MCHCVQVYERWAIKKWLDENGNRSPLTNVVISHVLEPLRDTDEGLVRGERHVESDSQGLKTEINTVRPSPVPGCNVCVLGLKGGALWVARRGQVNTPHPRCIRCSTLFEGA